MQVIPRRPGRRRLSRRLAAAALSAVTIAGVLAAGALPATAASRSSAGPQAAAARQAAGLTAAPVRRPALRRACPAAPAGYMRCYVLYEPSAASRAAAEGLSPRTTTPAGWGPTTLERAYRLPVSRHSRQTVAVSIAYRTPHLARYLKIYREHYGLPRCQTSTGCLRIVNQNGKASPRAPSGLNSGWDLEATLDVSMISASCPHCKILVVEADSATDADLGRTDNTAARLGAEVISNSYGQRENGQVMTYRKDYRHPGHMVVASSGDYGFDAANFPANLSKVTAVGGTELARSGNKRGFTERVWNSDGGAGSSGCSAYVAKPAWQHDKDCPGRTVADISAIAADVPIFNSAYGGWITVAGTSIAAPFVSGIYGLAGNASSLTPRYLYRHAADFFDITKGNDVLFGSAQQSCDDYLCEAKKGYDGPTGLGTPNGISGF